MRIVMIATLLTGVLCPAVARGGELRGAPPSLEFGHPVRAVGCYWESGRRYCSRYCYIEVNGREYCHNRLRHAQPQGPAIILVPLVAPQYRRLLMK